MFGYFIWVESCNGIIKTLAKHFGVKSFLCEKLRRASVLRRHHHHRRRKLLNADINSQMALCSFPFAVEW